MEASHKNFRLIVKNVHTSDGKHAVDFIEWYEKIRISLKIYDKGRFPSPTEGAGTICGDRHRRFQARGLEHGQRGLVQRAVLPDKRCSMLRRPPLCRQDTRRGRRTRTARVGRPSRKLRRLFEGSAQSRARQNELCANESGPRP